VTTRACVLALEDQPASDDCAVIERGLVEHAVAQGIEPRNHRSLTILARDGDGRVVGGLVGTTVWGWLQVTQLWVADAIRGEGHGAALMRYAEAEAVNRGCHHALLDTFDFQARGFYERLGYVVFGEVRDFPRGHTRFFMRKVLDGGSPA
jgi:GNAT superfamily N-acetyltransferase